jgi:hypothetical protein
MVAARLQARLASEGVALSPGDAERLHAWVIGGGVGTIRLQRWRWWDRRRITIALSAEDAAELNGDLATVFDRQPEALPGVIAEIAPELAAVLKRRWGREQRAEMSERRGLRRRLDQGWGDALAQLRMLLTVSREFGAAANDELRARKVSEPHKVEVLTRLHARACQVANEVLVLLAEGFADGGMARWRTLHEIAATALLVGEHGDDLAERYMLHDATEAFRAAVAYRQCQDRLGYEPMPDDVFAAVCDRKDRVVERFGQAFCNQYGWASELLSKDKPTFRDIECAAGTDDLRAHYRLASHGVHADPRGTRFGLGMLPGENLLLAGPRDVGLAEPGQRAATSLVQATTPLGLTLATVDLDALVWLQAMRLLQDEVGRAFCDAHVQLEGGAAAGE